MKEETIPVGAFGRVLDPDCSKHLQAIDPENCRRADAMCCGISVAKSCFGVVPSDPIRLFELACRILDDMDAGCLKRPLKTLRELCADEDSFVAVVSAMLALSLGKDRDDLTLHETANEIAVVLSRVHLVRGLFVNNNN